MADKNFEYLGNTFQLQLLNQIILDKNFASSIIDVTESSYFENKYFKIIIQMIKEYHTKYEHIPSFETLEQITKSEVKQELASKIVIDTIKNIKESSLDGYKFVQEKALKFCKQQELQKAITKAQKVIDGGDFESYDALEELIREALQVGEINNTTQDIFSGVEAVLTDDYRHPIPMGIPGIDKLLKGGLAKGEIGLIIAGSGVGKSTLATKIANHGFNMGFNVLQIFFEDNPKEIQRKHYTLWTEIPATEFAKNRDKVIERVNEIQNKMPNKLILKKLPSESVTMNQIKNQVKKIIADGLRIDLIILDYIDCVLAEKSYEDEWKSEGTTIRQFESMCNELEIAGWVTTQGSRQSISAELVTNDLVGGSIKKVQVGHIVITIAKTLQQKELKLATVAITKSRIGADGVIFENCKFDNEMLVIDTESCVTLLGFEEHKEQKKKERIKELIIKRSENKL